MDLWKALAAVITVSISADAVAWYVENPVERALTVTTLLPTMVLGATTAFTVDGPAMMKKAKSDALAFIGSDGEIRGAQFEQASRFYRSTYTPPLMSDIQLAQAIATSF
ncbi:DUF2388 domain-containing protein [Pseudomonas sp. R11-23-07]|uniref:DUF2388 domain-containing protein n=1 Tax=Pseudomonas sp. R11-23-07 TaxID=658632 RepID=UPI000F55DE29|nr:DUF2388 domain-containing protein [Pseudomonas sp. R11-23-07]